MRPIGYGVTGVAACLLLLGGVRAGDDAGKALNALKGEWITVSIEENGETKKPDAASAPRATFRGDMLILKVDGEELLYQVTIDPAKKPPTIDFKGSDKNAYGIYKLEKDKLTICATRISADDRPKAFSGMGDGVALVVLQRRK